MNALDLVGGGFAIYDSYNKLTYLCSGQLEWNWETAISTFGVGSIKLASGLGSTNPLLVASGSADIFAGTITAIDYFSQPFVLGVPVAELLDSALIGSGVAAALGCAEIVLSQDREKVIHSNILRLSERILTGGILATMSAIAVPMSVTAGFALSGFKLAKAGASDTQRYLQAVPSSGALATQLDLALATKTLGSEKLLNILSVLDEAP